MANKLYDLGRQAFLEGSIAWLTDTIKAALVNVAGGHYAPNLASDQFLSIIAPGDLVTTSAGLTGRTSAAGVAVAANVTFPLLSGAQCGALVIYKDTGVAASSPLIAYLDVGAGLPVTPSGGDVVIAWDPTNGIFKL